MSWIRYILSLLPGFKSYETYTEDPYRYYLVDDVQPTTNELGDLKGRNTYQMPKATLGQRISYYQAITGKRLTHWRYECQSLNEEELDYILDRDLSMWTSEVLEPVGRGSHKKWIPRSLKSTWLLALDLKHTHKGRDT